MRATISVVHSKGNSARTLCQTRVSPSLKYYYRAVMSRCLCWVERRLCKRELINDIVLPWNRNILKTNGRFLSVKHNSNISWIKSWRSTVYEPSLYIWMLMLDRPVPFNSLWIFAEELIELEMTEAACRTAEEQMEKPEGISFSSKHTAKSQHYWSILKCGLPDQTWFQLLQYRVLEKLIPSYDFCTANQFVGLIEICEIFWWNYALWNYYGKYPSSNVDNHSDELYENISEWDFCDFMFWRITTFCCLVNRNRFAFYHSEKTDDLME